MDGKATNTKSKSSSILKPPKQRQPFSEVHYDSSFEPAEATTIANRRVSFAEKKHVKEFCDSLEQGTVWDNTYEESDLSSMHIAVTSNSNLSSNEIANGKTVEDADNPSANIVYKNTSSGHILEDYKQCNATQFFHDASIEMTEIPLSCIQTQMSNNTIVFPNVSMEMTDIYTPVPQEANNMEEIDMSMEITEVVSCSVTDLHKKSSSNKTVVYHDDSMEMTCALQPPLSNRTKHMDDIDNDGAMDFTKPIVSLPLMKNREHLTDKNKVNYIKNQSRIFDQSMELTEMVPVLIQTKSCAKNLGKNECGQDMKNEETKIFQNESMTLTRIFPSTNFDQENVDKENDPCRSNMNNVNVNRSLIFTDLKHEDTIKDSTIHHTKIFHNESMTFTNVLPSVVMSNDHEIMRDISDSRKQYAASKHNEYHEMSMELTSAITGLNFNSDIAMKAGIDKENIIQCDEESLSEINENHEMSMELTSAITGLNYNSDKVMRAGIDEENIVQCDKENLSAINENHEMSMELTSAITGLNLNSDKAMKSRIDKENIIQCVEHNLSEINENHEMSMELTSAITGLNYNSDKVMRAGIDEENIVQCDKENLSEINENHEMSMELTSAITGLNFNSDKAMKARIDKENIIQCDEDNLSEMNEKHEMSMELINAITNLHSDSNKITKENIAKENIERDEQNLSLDNQNHEMSMELTRAITGLQPISNNIMKAEIGKNSSIQCERHNSPRNNEYNDMSMELTSEITGLQPISNDIMKTDIGKENSIQCKKFDASRSNEYNEMSIELTSAIIGRHPAACEVSKAYTDKENINHCDQQDLSHCEQSLENPDKFLEALDDEEQHFIRKSLTFFNDSADEIQLIEPPSLICTDSMMKDSFCEDAQILQDSQNSDKSEKAAFDKDQERLIETLNYIHEAEHIRGNELNISQDAQTPQKSLSEDELTDISVVLEKQNTYNIFMREEIADIEITNENSDTAQVPAEVRDLTINLDPFSKLIKSVKDQALRDDCIWNLFAESIDRKMIAASFISNSLVVAIFLDDTVKQIKIISRLLYDNDECVKMVHRIIMEKLDVHELKDTYAFYEDVVPLLSYISREVMLAMDFMLDLKRLNDLNLMEITENRISFISRAKKMKTILKVTINIKPFDSISRNDITVCTLLGSVRENDIKDLFMSIKKDYMFLRRYMEDVQTYIELIELR